MVYKDQKHPNTIDSLKKDFNKLGLENGMTIIVHSSLKSLGYVCGGPVAVIEALMATVGSEGTIVMPTQSGDLSDPAFWENPPVPKEWWEIIRNEMPAYDPRTTPTMAMGKIVECFRTYDGVIRSSHPTVSFAAWGNNKQYIIEEHSLDFSLCEKSPLQKLYDIGAYILLIGVDYENNTSLHLSECRANACFTIHQGSPVLENGVRVWKEYEDFIYDSDRFNEIGCDFEKQYSISVGKVGKAECRLIPMRQLVYFGTVWLESWKNSQK